MNNLQPDTPSFSSEISEEKIVECMRKSKSLEEYKIREKNFRFKLGNDFNMTWVKVMLLSGVSEDILKNFDEVANPWEDIKISDNSNRVAPF